MMLCLLMYTVLLIEDDCLCLAANVMCVKSSGRSMREAVKRVMGFGSMGYGFVGGGCPPLRRFVLCVIASDMGISVVAM